MIAWSIALCILAIPVYFFGLKQISMGLKHHNDGRVRRGEVTLFVGVIMCVVALVLAIEGAERV